MMHQKIALFIFDMSIAAICVTAILLLNSAMSKYDEEQDAAHNMRIAMFKSHQAALNRAEWTLLLKKCEELTTFKSEMK